MLLHCQLHIKSSDDTPKLRGYSQVKERVNIAFAAVCAGLASKKNNIFLTPILEPGQGSQCSALEAVRFSLGLIPSTNFLLCEKVSILLRYVSVFGENREKLTRWESFGQTP